MQTILQLKKYRTSALHSQCPLPCESCEDPCAFPPSSPWQMGSGVGDSHSTQTSQTLQTPFPL